MLWLRCDCPEGLVRAVASLPGLWHEPAQRPQRRQEHFMAPSSSSAFGDSRGYPRGRTENPGGCEPPWSVRSAHCYLSSEFYWCQAHHHSGSGPLLPALTIMVECAVRKPQDESQCPFPAQRTS